IVLENMVLQAHKGIDVQEATGITFKNIKVISDETNPVIDVVHSDKLIFDNITYENGAELLFRINGERSSNISIKNTDASKAKEKIRYELGATEKSTTITASPVPAPLNEKWSERLSETVQKIWPDSFTLEGDKAAKWRYDQGVILKGIRAVWAATGDGQWFEYIRKSMDLYIQDDGSIRGYKPDEYNIDHINNGKLVLFLFQVTGKEKYKKAADLLREQLRTHPRTSEGGYWHKKIYPYQMWLDGLYMAQPFYAEYAKLFHEDTIFDDVARQFILMEKNALDKKTGLLYHGWDESREQQWANKATGQSPNFWGRSLGWFGMALVDVLDHFPANHPKRPELIAILNRFAVAVRKVQDAKTGLWYDVPNMPTTPKNYLEASGSCMLAFTFAKGVRKGYLPEVFLNHAREAYRGIIKEFIETDANGQVNLKGTVAVSGLGGKPYRDGSFEYYMREPVIVNDPKGMGAFIKCAAEMELSETQPAGKGKTVLLDYYFNNEWKKDITGTPARWHYTWEDKTNSGYAMLSDLFSKYGVKTKSLITSPASTDLKGASIYIIVDPDTEKETDKPNFLEPVAANIISNWVKDGGVLVLLGNDAGNAEFKNFNGLAGKFGVQFNEDSKNRVQNDQFEQGDVITPEGHAIFGSSKKL
ncbi:MAG: glycoside hydrolase family 88 protein, partial [Ferruginibacter sp.]|nr:glycoside hydrolase family 88 protein [Chitinophagaceae bacterium]